METITFTNDGTVIKKLCLNDTITESDFIGFIENKKPSLIPVVCCGGLKVKDISHFFDNEFQGFYRKT